MYSVSDCKIVELSKVHNDAGNITVLENNKEGITEIEKHSKSLLNQYATMLNNSAVPFHKETSIIW